MQGRIFVAGAFGAIGQRLMPLLVRDGSSVLGVTRSQQRADTMRALGIPAVVVDALLPDGIMQAISAFRPDVVMHQMTDLPRDLSQLNAAALERNAVLRQLGTRNLLDAAEANGVKRVVAQSIAFDYAAGRRPHTESDTVAGRLPEASASSLGVVALEDQIAASPLPSVILRYGRIYGPGTGSDKPWGPAGLHVDAAACAAVLAALKGEGVFNIAEDDGEVDSSRAKDILGWDAGWRRAGC